MVWCPFYYINIEKIFSGEILILERRGKLIVLCSFLGKYLIVTYIDAYPSLKVK